MFKRLTSLQSKFLLILLPSVVLVTFIGILTISTLTFERHKESRQHEYQNLVTLYASLLSEPLWNFDRQSVKQAIDTLALNRDVLMVIIYDDESNIYEFYQRENIAALGNMNTLETNILYQQNGKQRVIGRLKIGFVQIDLMSSIQDEISRFSLLVLGIVITITLGALLSHRFIISRPLSHFLHAIRQTEEGHGLEPVKCDTQDELGRVINAYNHMILRLREEEEELINLTNEQNTILENSLIGIAYIKNRVFYRCNSQMLTMFGAPGEDALNGSSTQKLFLSHEDFTAFGLRAYPVLASGEFYKAQQKLCRLNGEVFWCQVTGKAIDCSDLSKGSIWVFEDIDEQRRVESELRLAATVFDSISEGVMILDHEFKIRKVNPTFVSITGYTSVEAVEQTPEFMASGHQAREFYMQIWRQLREKHYWSGEIWCKRKDGELYLEHLTISPVHHKTDALQTYVAVFTDITQQKQDEEVIRYQANYDSLTQLPNRTLFSRRLLESLGEAKKHGHTGALLFLDLDHFKWVNDTKGHSMGDMLLQEAAHRLSTSVHVSATVARLGGDEFTIIVPNIESRERLESLVDQLLEVIARPYVLEGTQIFVSVSIGVTLFPDDAGDVENLLKNADTAMYQAKLKGRNTYKFYTEKMHQDAMARIGLENDLRNGLLSDEFKLYYQPIVDLKTHRIVGAEALIRWFHPTRGMIPPDDFIPLAEETGLIIKLGRWIVASVAHQALLWNKLFCRQSGCEGKGLYFSINLSPRQCLEPGEPEKLCGIVDDSGIDAELLTMEVTENIVMSGNERAAESLNVFKKAGMKISMDDFGTGYSSLAYLKRFPVDYLKIDRSFIHDVPEDAGDKELVKAIISMSHSLNLQVVAEGVEEAEQESFLEKLQCDYVQGYYYSKPLPVEDFEHLLSTQQALSRNLP